MKWRHQEEAKRKKEDEEKKKQDLEHVAEKPPGDKHKGKDCPPIKTQDTIRDLGEKQRSKEAADYNKKDGEKSPKLELQLPDEENKLKHEIIIP